MSKAESKVQEDIKVEKCDDFQIGGNNDFKTGQKYPTPAPANGDRVFYESLLVQVPTSEMAQEWCVAYGVLDDDAARRVDKIICTRKGVKQNVIVKKQSNSSSSSSSSSFSSSNNNSGPASKIGTSTKGMKKKVISSKNTRNEEDFVMDSGLADSSVWEGQGSSGL